MFLISSWDLVNSALRNPDLQAGSGVSEAFGGAGAVYYDVLVVFWGDVLGEAGADAPALAKG